MKKLLILLLFIPCLVFADAAAPTIEPYVGIIKNENGAHLYRYDLEKKDYVASDATLDYGTKIYIYDEFDRFLVSENYNDYLLKEDVEKTDIKYEDYLKEKNELEGIVPSKNDVNKQEMQNNTHKTLYTCVLIAIILFIIAIVIIIVVNKRKRVS